MSVNKFGQNSSYKQYNKQTCQNRGYIDDNFVRLDGTSKMRGDLNLNKYKVLNISSLNPRDAVTKVYVDQMQSNLIDKIEEKLSLTGGTMKGSVNMGNFAITNIEQSEEEHSVATVKFVRDEYLKLSEMFKNLFKPVTTALIDVEKYIMKKAVQYIEVENKNVRYWIESESDITIAYDSVNTKIAYDSVNTKIKEIHDLTSNKNKVYMHSSAKSRPKISTDLLNGKRYIQFDGESFLTNELNLRRNREKPDILSVFIVYKILDFNDDTRTEYTNGLFGDAVILFERKLKDIRAVCFSKPNNKGVANLVVHGTNDLDGELTVGPGKGTSDLYLKKAEPGKKGIVNCLSIHWDLPENSFGSSIYCNGKKLSTFTASDRDYISEADSELGNIWDYKKGLSTIIPFIGNIYSFLVFKDQSLQEQNIKGIHNYFIKRWNIEV